MLIEIVSPYELLVHYKHRPPFRLYDSNGKVLELWTWFQSSSTLPYETFKRAVVTEGEETCLNITLCAA